MNLFIDTSAFVALAAGADQFHREAKEFYETLRPLDKLHTSNYVLDETITRLRFSAGFSVSLKFAKELFHNSSFQIHTINPACEKAALAVFEKYKDYALSFTDCTNFVLMQELDISEIFTFDEDFKKIGCRVYP